MQTNKKQTILLLSKKEAVQLRLGLLTESLTWGQMSYSLAPSSTLMEHLSKKRKRSLQMKEAPAAAEAEPAPYLAPLDSLRMMWLVRSYTFPSQNS